jgi:N-methylhydantoinase B
MTIRRGDVFRHEQPGPGGWGDPLERDPWRVLKDVRNEFISLAAAREDYGVVIDTTTWTVKEDETTKLRHERRVARDWTETPSVLRS